MGYRHVRRRKKLSVAVSSALSTEDEFEFEKYLDQKMHAQLPHRKGFLQTQFRTYMENGRKNDHSSKLTVQEAVPLDPEIVRDIALVVAALPPTQISVERLF